MYFLGIDLGSSSIKLCVFDPETGKSIADVTVPEFEMEMKAPEFGWAEQDPDTWWEYTKNGIGLLKSKKGIDLKKITGIGIAYQMHGLVLTDEALKPLRPSIIWCDSRAAEIGNKAYHDIGAEFCQDTILGSPGNFTASKLKWVKENEPEVFKKAAHLMLPGDFIAAKLSRKAQTSKSGLSEAALWNFSEGRLATKILDRMELPEAIIPEVVDNFDHQATIHVEVAEELGLCKDVKITYRAGDQPNNAFSLNVTQPGEIATTAGTSAVIYSVSDHDVYDRDNRVNTFLNTNDKAAAKRNGVLLCINGSGILYQWLRKIMSLDRDALVSYELLNAQAAKANPGSEGLLFYPFGNGVERIFNNKKAASGIQNLNFNIHQSSHLVRAACEGIVFAMNYGFEVMQAIGASGDVVRAGKANLFLSPVFREIFVNTTQTTLELYNTTGAEGAARGAAKGYGFYKTDAEVHTGLKTLETLKPDKELSNRYKEIYTNWKESITIYD